MGTNQSLFTNKDLPLETIQEIEEIYREAKKKIELLGKQRQDIIKKYIKQLEDQKVQSLRTELGLSE